MTIALLIAGGVHVAGFALFSVQTPQSPLVVTPPATIALLPSENAGADPRLREYLALTDQRRLYRASSREVGAELTREAARRVPGDALEQFEPEMTYSTSALTPLVPTPGGAPKTPLEALRTGDRGQFSEFGRSDQIVRERVTASAWLTVRSMESGRLVFREPLGDPVAPALTRQDWSPAEFTVLVSPGGLVGAPVLAKSSTEEEIDRVLRVYLGRDAHLGERLAPGFYRVGISP